MDDPSLSSRALAARASAPSDAWEGRLAPASAARAVNAAVHRLAESLLRSGPYAHEFEQLILGLIVFSSCSHAGIVNVCSEVRRLFPEIPIHCVMGGLHLGGVMERIIPETVEGLQPFAIPYIITGHCTGWRALHALANAFGDAVSQSAVGTTYTFAP